MHDYRPSDSVAERQWLVSNIRPFGTGAARHYPANDFMTEYGRHRRFPATVNAVEVARADRTAENFDEHLILLKGGERDFPELELVCLSSKYGSGAVTQG
jgi:hypothetical protein